MEIVLTVIAVIVLALGIAESQTGNISKKPENLPSFENNSPTSPGTATPTPTPEQPVTASPVPKTLSPQVENMGEFVYPGASIISSAGQDLTLTSNDDPDKITSWYKDKIKTKNLNVTTFVTTKANDKVLNKLAGDNGQITIKVEVSREALTTPVKITIGISSP